MERCKKVLSLLEKCSDSDETKQLITEMFDELKQSNNEKVKNKYARKEKIVK